MSKLVGCRQNRFLYIFRKSSTVNHENICETTNYNCRNHWRNSSHKSISNSNRQFSQMGTRRKVTNYHPNSSYLRSGFSSFFIRSMDKKDRERNLPKLEILFDELEPDYISIKKYPYPYMSNRYFYRKFFRIGIKNSGGTVAERCEGTFRILSKDIVDMTREQKQITWDSREVYEDIGVEDTAYLDVVFINSEIIRDVKKRAYVSTPSNLKEDKVYSPDIRDGLVEGDFEFEVMVREINGKFVRGKFQIHLEQNYENSSMKRLFD